MVAAVSAPSARATMPAPALVTPIRPDVVTPTTLTLTRGTLARALKAAIPFACVDATRFHLCGICIEVVSGAGHAPLLQIAATDGHTLVRIRAPLKTSEGLAALAKRRIILGSDDVRALAKAAACAKRDADQPIAIGITPVGVTVQIGATMLTMRPVDATYPPEQVIPTDSATSTTSRVWLNPAYLARACDAAVAMHPESSCHGHGVRVQLGAKEFDPILVTREIDGIEFLAVVMPMSA